MIVEENYAELAIVVDKCVVVSNKKAIVPVKVITLDKGSLPTNIERNVLGKILNSNDVEVNIKNIKSKYVDKINIDTLKTEDNLSNIYYSMDSNDGRISLEKYDELMNFDLEYVFKDVPSSINVLGTNVYLNNTETCQVINGYKTEVVVDNNDNHISNIIPIIVFIILIIVAASEFFVIKIKRKK